MASVLHHTLLVKRLVTAVLSKKQTTTKAQEILRYGWLGAQMIDLGKSTRSGSGKNEARFRI